MDRRMTVGTLAFNGAVAGSTVRSASLDQFRRESMCWGSFRDRFTSAVEDRRVKGQATEVGGRWQWRRNDKRSNLISEGFRLSNSWSKTLSNIGAVLLEARTELHQLGFKLGVHTAFSNTIVRVMVTMTATVSLNHEFIKFNLGETSHEASVFIFWGISCSEVGVSSVAFRSSSTHSKGRISFTSYSKEVGWLSITSSQKNAYEHDEKVVVDHCQSSKLWINKPDGSSFP